MLPPTFTRSSLKQAFSVSSGLREQTSLPEQEPDACARETENTESPKRTKRLLPPRRTGNLCSEKARLSSRLRSGLRPTLPQSPWDFCKAGESTERPSAAGGTRPSARHK